MLVRAKRPPTDGVEITISFGGTLRHFRAPRRAAKKILRGVEALDDVRPVDDNETAPGSWRDDFADLIEKYTEPGLALRGSRVKEGLTQKKLAEMLGLTQPDIANMEHGRRPISKSMARKLGKILNVGYKVFL